MSEMIERVAKAMVRAQFNEWEQLDGGDQSYFLNAARAAVREMRSPTVQMVAQTCVWTADATAEQEALAAAAMRHMSETDERGHVAAAEVVRDWQMMIDTALNDHTQAKG